MKIISYFTKNTPYETEINKKLLPSLKQFNLDYEIKGFKDRGSWASNTAIKSQFILECLLKYKEPIIFLDADAIILKYPKLFFELENKDLDLAYHHFYWKKFWRNQDDPNEIPQLLSGTMMFWPNEKVINLVKKWVDNVQLNVQQWEQKTLELLVYSRNDLKIYNLPISYCTILKQGKSIPSIIKKEDVFILHTQASRKLKRRQNWEDCK